MIDIYDAQLIQTVPRILYKMDQVKASLWLGKR